MKEKKGMYISFTGIDGAGKTTQANLLGKWLRENEVNAIIYEERRNFVSEITDTIAKRHEVESGRKYLGENLYLVCLSFEVLSQTMLKIQPYIINGITVISPRTIFDWLAGGIARGCPPKEFGLAKEIILFGKSPDLTIWLDTSPKIANERIYKRGFDKGHLNYLQVYREAFVNLLKEYPHVRINGDDKIQKIHSEVQCVVQKLLQVECK